ncbi:MAG: methyl-accepting chemotaxis protein, partial [Cyanobacteria bacterium P01_H01_bin.15]
TQTVTQRDENNLPPGEEPTFVVSSDLPDPSPGGLDYLSVDHSKFKGDETNLLAEESQDSEFLSSDDDFEMSEDDFSSFQDDISQIHDQLSEFELSGGQQTEIVDTRSGRFSPEAVAEPLELDSSSSFVVDEQDTADFEALESGSVLIDDGEELLTGLSGAASEQLVKPQVDENVQASLPFLANAPLLKKQLICAAATGVATFLSVVIAGFLGGNESVPSSGSVSVSGESGNKGVMALVAGVVGFGSTLAVGQISTIQMKRSINNLQEQFDHVLQGNLDTRATVYAEDELGRLSSSFNEMSRVVLTTTKDAQRRAEETEQAREDLQRQVIRLLDEVEGAARGDLTVQAEVTADVLGAVADAFNLTIQNLREIVQQVKQAALQVNRGSTDSESFARNQSSDALRMAEELAVTLNSVQMMTESIQRVAENAREAEEVARTSSGTALRGGKAVERTVAGILQIRETVSETARKVKRLAEASQEISKIVALISQIASRTNLLALNASIQAARAGEAGRGFAIVADEVRQLADRSAKSLKEIEQIVLQIQSETGSVMTAMEEGIQQVIDVTDRAEQAKKSLEDIIEVSNHIDSLVRSITADTVEQRENSLAVAQVMQSVELTAQETSQESQRVAGSLQNLVSISQELLASVERFRVNAEAG